MPDYVTVAKIKEWLEPVYFDNDEGCSERDCFGCKSDFEQVAQAVCDQINAVGAERGG